VDPAAPGTAELLELLWKTLLDDGGVGLAAPQIGRNERVVVVMDPEQKRGQRKIGLVNPVIRETFGPMVAFEEGCLSFPGLYTRVWRPQGNETLSARIIQHEIDHLEGILFIDHLSIWQRILLWPRLMSYVIFEIGQKVSGNERGA